MTNPSVALKSLSLLEDFCTKDYAEGNTDELREACNMIREFIMEKKK